VDVGVQAFRCSDWVLPRHTLPTPLPHFQSFGFQGTGGIMGTLSITIRGSAGRVRSRVRRCDRCSGAEEHPLVWSTRMFSAVRPSYSEQRVEASIDGYLHLKNAKRREAKRRRERERGGSPSPAVVVVKGVLAGGYPPRHAVRVRLRGACRAAAVEARALAALSVGVARRGKRGLHRGSRRRALAQPSTVLGDLQVPRSRGHIERRPSPRWRHRRFAGDALLPVLHRVRVRVCASLRGDACSLLMLSRCSRWFWGCPPSIRSPTHARLALLALSSVYSREPGASLTLACTGVVWAVCLSSGHTL